MNGFLWYLGENIGYRKTFKNFCNIIISNVMQWNIGY